MIRKTRKASGKVRFTPTQVPGSFGERELKVRVMQRLNTPRDEQRLGRFVVSRPPRPGGIRAMSAHRHSDRVSVKWSKARHALIRGQGEGRGFPLIHREVVRGRKARLDVEAIAPLRVTVTPLGRLDRRGPGVSTRIRQGRDALISVGDGPHAYRCPMADETRPGDGRQLGASVPDTSADPALVALARVRAAGRRSAARRTPRPTQFTAAGPDARDPQPLGSCHPLGQRERIRPEIAVAGLADGWATIVGEQVAAHVTVGEFTAATGDLVLQADSPEWALQLRYLMGQLQRRIDEEIGPDVVRRITVRGPGRPPWAAGAFAPEDAAPRIIARIRPDPM